MKMGYEGTIGSYNFQMVEDDTIEVWSNFDNEHPESYIYVKPGSINNQKSFDMEISYWYLENVG